MCVCERERVCVCADVHTCVCVCVCVEIHKLERVRRGTFSENFVSVQTVHVCVCVCVWYFANESVQREGRVL